MGGGRELDQMWRAEQCLGVGKRPDVEEGGAVLAGVTAPVVAVAAPALAASAVALAVAPAVAPAATAATAVAVTEVVVAVMVVVAVLFGRNDLDVVGSVVLRDGHCAVKGAGDAFDEVTRRMIVVGVSVCGAVYEPGERPLYVFVIAAVGGIDGALAGSNQDIA